MKIALIGIGKLANYQMQAISHVQGVSLLDAHDCDKGRAEELPGSVDFYKNLDEMLNHSKADVFLISTPTSTHYEIALKVIEADRVAVVEKPIGITNEQEEILRNTATRRKLPLYTMFHAAYGREVEWWVEQRTQKNFDLGSLLGFESCFLESYYLNGLISAAATGKTGAWIDSGIASLSVLARFLSPQEIELVEGRMTRISGLACSEVQGSGIFRFKADGRNGFGLVDTNWALGRSHKTTRLWYENGVITLDHSRELAQLSSPDHKDLTFNLTTDKPRLVNHFCGALSNLRDMYNEGTDNQRLSSILHRLLFAASGHFSGTGAT